MHSLIFEINAYPVNHDQGAIYVNSLDPNETLNNSAYHLDPSCLIHKQYFHYLWMNLKHLQHF